MAIKHAFTAPDAIEGADATKVRKSDWNENHTVDVSGVLKGAAGDIVAAIPGVDFETPSSSLGLSLGIALNLSPL